jgi:hypothetical protein
MAQTSCATTSKPGWLPISIHADELTSGPETAQGSVMALSLIPGHQVRYRDGKR